MHEKKVTIELTDAQKQQLKKEAGIEINSLTYDALEDRFAPKVKQGFMKPDSDLNP